MDKVDYREATALKEIERDRKVREDVKKYLAP